MSKPWSVFFFVFGLLMFFPSLAAGGWAIPMTTACLILMFMPLLVWVDHNRNRWKRASRGPKSEPLEGMPPAGLKREDWEWLEDRGMGPWDKTLE